MTTILFGSISTLADTSELQREAFNAAFAVHGLDWRWDREEYVDLLRDSGGQDRIAAQATARGEQVDAAAVHATKSELFQQALATSGVEPRPGVLDVVRAARAAGHRVGLVTTTSPANVSALLQALAPEVSEADFDVVVDRTQVERPKPDPQAYEHALRALEVRAGDVVAVEDNVDGVRAAIAAGLTCVAFPNRNTADHDFSAAATVVDRLVPEDLERVRAA